MVPYFGRSTPELCFTKAQHLQVYRGMYLRYEYHYQTPPPRSRYQ
jgi:hypothetical protein